MAESFAFDVFLSHNSKDKERVHRLADRLKAAGLRVWFSEWNVRSGDIIALKVDEGLEQSRVLVLCISANALASGWVALERSTAIHRDPSNADRRFIPLLLTDCDLPGTLRRYKYVDFRDETDVAFEELVVACRPLADTISKESTEASEPAREKPRQTILPTRSKATDPQPVNASKKPKFILEGHSRAVCGIAFTPDGKTIISSSWDETLRVWDLETKSCRHVLKGHSQSVRGVAATPDSKYAISCSGDGTMKVWSLENGSCVLTLDGIHDSCWRLAVSGDGKTAITASDGNSAGVWDLQTGKRLKTLIGHRRYIRGVAMSNDGKTAVTGSNDHTLRIWNVETGKCVATFAGHSNQVDGVAISPDGQTIVSGSYDRTIKTWDMKTERCLSSIEGHGDEVNDIALTHDGKAVVSADDDKTVRIWDLATGQCHGIFQHPDKVYSVAISPNDKLIVSGSYDGIIRVWDLSPATSTVGNTRRYVNAKVVLLGEGTVGKTSLAHRLVEDQYVVRDRSHGMKVWRLDLPLPPDDSMDREALLWDLAGQEDYRLIHRLFLNETALALLLVNPQKNDPFAEVGDWLKTLRTAVEQDGAETDISKLLIFSQIDVGGMKLGNAKIERFREQYGFSGWLSTSAKTGENCSDSESAGQTSKLKKLIAESIPWDKLPWTSTPRLLAELKNSMVSMRDEQDIRLLRFKELAQRLEQTLPNEKFGESDVRTAVTLLANHGLARPLKFGDLVLLQPELLNGYGAAIIRAARAHTDELGTVLESDIYRPNFDFTGVDRLKHRPDEELLLRALVQTFLDHSLCIAEETSGGRHLVFPSQYRREKDLPRDPDILVSYSFSGEWQTVWTTLIVRLWYSQEFKHRELWRNAAEFASPKGFALGLKIDHKQGEGTATISLYFDVEVPDELQAIFIEYVHKHLARYGCEVTRIRRYVCLNCKKPVKDLEAVQKRLADKKTFIYCQDCDEKVELLDFLEQRLKSDPVAQKILAMEAITTRELDAQALEQILIGHMMAIAGEANQIFRPVTMFDYGIDGEVEFKDDDGRPSGKKIYIQLKSGNSYLRTRKSDGSEIFDVRHARHLDFWINQPVDVYLVVRQTDEVSRGQVIRWMNVTHHLKTRSDKTSRQIIFEGEKLDMDAMWRARDRFFPASNRKQK
jgi:WD40 repeat protein/DNA-directed RNA polymerase subunit RPC12/RpoP